MALKDVQSTAPWAIELDRIIEAIQRRALHDPQCQFTTPRVVAAPKTGTEDVFRPICVFGVEDSIIGSLAGRYLRERFNPFFDRSCLAFRAGRPGLRSPDRHGGITRLMEFRQRHQDRPLFVAEIDLRGFYDCVDHEMVWQCLQDLTAEARRYCEVMGAGGGYILGPAHLFQTDVPPQNILAVYRGAA